MACSPLSALLLFAYEALRQRGCFSLSPLINACPLFPQLLLFPPDLRRGCQTVGWIFKGKANASLSPRQQQGIGPWSQVGDVSSQTSELLFQWLVIRLLLLCVEKGASPPRSLDQ